MDMYNQSEDDKKLEILNFLNEEEEELHYPIIAGKTKAVQCSYCTADLGLCFQIMKIWFSHDAALNDSKAS